MCHGKVVNYLVEMTMKPTLYFYLLTSLYFQPFVKAKSRVQGVTKMILYESSGFWRSNFRFYWFDWCSLFLAI
jgi:hypothetical protein